MARQRIGVEAIFDVTQFNQGLQIYMKGMIDAEKATNQAANSVSRAGDLIAVGFGGALGAATIAQIEGIINALRRLGQEALETVRFFERLQFSMQALFAIEMTREGQFDDMNEALVEGDRLAKAYILSLQDIAIFSPFTTEEVGKAYQLLNVYGFTRDAALALTESLVDMASATGRSDEQLRNIAYAMGQIRSEQRLLARDAMQLTNAGIQVYDALMEHTGMTWAQLQEQQRQGNISSQVTFEALIKWMDRFDGSGVRVSKTLNGLMSSLQDIQQINFKNFFGAVFEPILPIMEEMVTLFTDPEFAASINLLGELIGTQLANAISLVRTFVNNLVGSFSNLSPQVIQAALAFGFVAVALTGLAAAAGLTFVAVNLLINPFTVLVFAISSFAAAYITNFANIGTATNTFLTAINNMVDGASRALDELVRSFSTTVSNIGNMLADLGDLASGWGINIVESIAAGMIGAVSAVIDAISVLGSVMTFFLAPGSPPRFLPLLDVWGTEAAQVYLDGWTDADFGVLDEVGSQIQKILTDMFKDGNLPAIDFDRLVRESFHAFALAVDELKEAGEISEDALNRIKTAAGPAGDALIELAKSYERIFKASNLSKVALENTSQLLELVSNSFTSDDFSAFSQFGSAISGLITQLADLGKIKEIDVPGLIIGSRDTMANIIRDLRTFGKLSDEVFTQIAASPVAEKLQGFADVYAGVVKATTEATAAQDQFTASQQATTIAQNELNNTLDRYDALLKPLKDSLTEATEDSTLSEEAKEIRQLQRLIASGATSALQKEEARLKIAKIQATQRVRALELEKSAAEDAGQTVVDAAKTEEDLARDRLTAAQQYQSAQEAQLKLLMDKLNLETETLGLYNQQITLFEEQQKAIEELFTTQEDLIAELQKSYLDALDKANKERERAAKKLLSPLERQLKLFQLQQEELASLLKIAKARYTLADAESTEYERQNAALTLQTELAKRLQREKEYIELGGDIGTLQRLRDVNFTLEDILGKGKTGKSPLAGVVSDLDLMADHDPLEQLKEWEDAMATVRERFTGIATDVNKALGTLNESLPTFLRFQSVAGETAPILTVLGAAFTYMTTSFVATKIISSLKTLGGILLGTASKSNLLVGAISLLATAWVTNWGDIHGKTKAAITAVELAIAAFQTGIKTRVGQFASIAAGIRYALLSLIPAGSRNQFMGFMDGLDRVGKAMDAFVVGFKGSANVLDGVFFGLQLATSRLFPKETADKIIGFMNTVRNAIKSLVDGIQSFITNPLDFNKIFNLEGFESFEEFISGMPQWVQDSFAKVTDTVKTFRDKFVGILTSILQLAGINLGALLVIFQNNLRIISAAIAGVGLSILKVFAGDFEGAKQTLQSTLTTIVNLFKENLGKAFEAVDTARIAIVLAISSIAGPLFSRLATLARSGLASVMAEVGKFGRSIIAIIPSFFMRALSVTASGIGAGAAVVFNAIANAVSTGISGALLEALTRFREFLLGLSKISVIDSVMAGARTSINLVVTGFWNLYYAVTGIWQRAITFLDILNVRFVESMGSVVGGLGKFNVKFVGFIESGIGALGKFGVRFVGFMEKIVGAYPAILNFAVQIGKVWVGAFELALVGITNLIQRVTGLGKPIGVSIAAVQGFVAEILRLGSSTAGVVDRILPTAISLFNRFKVAVTTAFTSIGNIIRGTRFVEIFGSIRTAIAGVGTSVSTSFNFNPLRAFFNLIQSVGASVGSLLASIGNSLTGVATAANEVKVGAAIRGFINFIVDIFASGIRGVTTLTRGFFNLLSVFKPANIISAFSSIFRSLKTVGSAIGGLLNPLNLVLFAIDFFSFAWSKTFSGVGEEAKTLGETIKQAWADLISGKIWADIVAAVSPWMTRLGEVWQDVQENGFDSEVLKTFMTDLGNTIVENLKSIGESMWNSIVTFWAPTLWQWVKDSVTSLVTELTGMLIAIGTWIQNAAILIKAKFTDEWIPAFTNWWTENDVNGKIVAFLGTMWTAISEWVVTSSAWIYTKFTEEWLPGFVDWVVEVTPKVIEKLLEWATAIRDWIAEQTPVLTEKLLDWAIAFVEWLGPATTKVYKKLGEWAGAILRWIIGTGLPMMVGGMAKMIGAFVNWISGNEDSADTKVGEKLGILIEAIVTYVTDFFIPAVITLFMGVANGMWQGIKDAWALIDWTELGTTITDGAKGLGKNMIDGIKEGFGSNVESAKNAFTDGLGWIVDKAKEAIESDSPSRLTARILGAPMAEGVVAGWQSGLTDSETTSSTYLTDWVNSLFTDNTTAETNGAELGNKVVGAFQGTVTDGEEKTTTLLSGFASRVAQLAATETGTSVLDAVRGAVDLVQLVLEFVQLGTTVATAVKDGVDAVGEPLASWMRNEVAEAVIALQVGTASVATVGEEMMESLKEAIDVDVLKKSGEDIVDNFIKTLSDILKQLASLNTKMNISTLTGATLVATNFTTLRTKSMEQIKKLYDESLAKFNDIKKELVRITGELSVEVIAIVEAMKVSIIGIIDALETDVTGTFADIRTSLNTEFGLMRDEANTIITAMKDAAILVMGYMYDGMVEKAKDIKKDVIAEIEKILDHFDLKETKDKWYEAGKEIGYDLADGIEYAIRDKIDEIAKAAEDAVKAAIKAAKDAADAASPSKKMIEEVGNPLVDGILMPLKDGVKDAEYLSNKLVNAAIGNAEGFTPEWEAGFGNPFDETTTGALQLLEVVYELNGAFRQIPSMLPNMFERTIVPATAFNRTAQTGLNSPLTSLLEPRISNGASNVYYGPTTYTTNNYNLGVYTSQTPEVVQRSFAIMEVLSQ